MNPEQTPLVSVCVVTYNHENYIRQCLDSILDQQCSFPYEICIGEDESSDGTRAICQDYADRHPDKIRLFLRSRKDVVYIDGCVTGRVNFVRTLEACRGEYIALCEGDDFWTDLRKLQQQVDFMKDNPGCALTYCNVEVLCDGADRMHPGYQAQAKKLRLQAGQLIKPKAISTITDLAKVNFIHTPGVLFRNWIRDAGLPELLWKTRLGDWPLHLCSAMHGDVRLQDQCMAGYRVHASGTWSMKSDMKRIGSTLQTVSEMAKDGHFGPEITELLKTTLLDLFTGAWLTSMRANDKGSIMELFSVVEQTLPDAATRVLTQLWEHSPRKKKKRRIFRRH